MWKDLPLEDGPVTMDIDAGSRSPTLADFALKTSPTRSSLASALFDLLGSLLMPQKAPEIHSSVASSPVSEAYLPDRFGVFVLMITSITASDLSNLIAHANLQTASKPMSVIGPLLT